MTVRGRSSSLSPLRASSYARRPPTWTAEWSGGTCSIVPPESVEGGLDGRAIERGAVERRELAVEVVGRRGRSQRDGRTIGLVVREVVLDHPRGPPDEHRQDAARERVERAAVADPTHPGQAPDEGHDVVRRRSHRLVDDEDAVGHACWSVVRDGLRTVRHATWSSSSSVRAVPRTRGRASAIGSSIVAPAARAWPPPPKAPVRRGRVHAPVARPHARCASGRPAP